MRKRRNWRTLENGWGEAEEDGKTFWNNMYHMGNYPVSTWKIETLSSAAEINFREQPEETAKNYLCITICVANQRAAGWRSL